MSRRSRILLRVMACTMLAFVVGVTLAWRQLPTTDPGPLPKTLTGWTAFGVGFMFCAALGVWTVKGLLALMKASNTPPHGSAPTNGVQTLLQDSASTLTLLEEQQRTLRDLSEGFHALRAGQQDMVRAVERVAKALEKAG
jgi:hypothetical protein